jgi:eukaryotic-like serine/threonine-protein kinase
MDESRWRRIEAICDEALKLSPDERQVYLDRTCGGDAALRGEVESLLVHEGNAERFLDSSVGAVAAHLMPAHDVIGRRFADYEITAKLGEGGMGEVYRARDGKLGRDVAIKILPTVFAADRDRMHRFQREARLLATVNHPRIGAIYGVIEIDRLPALVLELVDGETLSVALSRGALALPRALTLAAQIADALEHAHRRGITHRDLKPANIMLTRDGVKLLDFGVGKWTPAPIEGTMTRPSTLTGEGAIVGTLQYMSPEQLEGGNADARSDIFSFGAVLFEMLSGRKAFDGPSQASIIAAVIEAPRPRLSGVGGPHASRLDRIVSKCLAKDPDERWQSARDLGDELRWLGDDLNRPAIAESALAASRGPSTWLTFAAAALAITAIGVASWGAWERWRTPAAAIELPRFEIHPPPGVTYDLRGFDLSQDGKQLLYTDSQTIPGNGRGLWIRRFNRFESLLLPGTADARSPRFSPDGQWVAFLSRGALRKIRTDGSTPPQVVGENIDGPIGLIWKQPGTILISTVGARLRRINADGGTLVEFMASPGKGEVDLHSPFPLPDGRNMLVAVHSPNNQFSIAVQSIDGDKRKTVVESGFAPTYLSSGHLVFGRGSTILAAPFDATRLEVTGAAVPLVESVDNDPQSGIIDYRLSSSGALAYIPLQSSNRRTLTWLTSDGKAAPIAVPTGEFDALRVSPDGSQIAYTLRQDGRRQIWIHEFASGRRVQMTRDGDHRAPIWTWDGHALIYGKTTASGSEVVAHPLNGEAATIARSPNRLFPAALTPDSQTLLLTESLPTDETFITQVDMHRPGTNARLPFKGGDPSSASLSPDGRWVAFAALQAGVVQVFVQSFPPSGTPRQISVDGGRAPMWSRNGRTLFFRSVGRVSTVSTVSIDTSRGLTWTSPRLLFEANTVSTFADYDVAPDGRLAMIASDPEESSSPHFNIILNWATEVRSRVPVPR